MCLVGGVNFLKIRKKPFFRFFFWNSVFKQTALVELLKIIVIQIVWDVRKWSIKKISKNYVSSMFHSNEFLFHFDVHVLRVLIFNLVRSYVCWFHFSDKQFYISRLRYYVYFGHWFTCHGHIHHSQSKRSLWYEIYHWLISLNWFALKVPKTKDEARWGMLTIWLIGFTMEY